MNISPVVVDTQRSLEQFKHLLFHLQMECGSIDETLRFFKEDSSFVHFEALRDLDPKLMPQLLARELVLEARRSLSQAEARQHLEKALQLDPLCPDACLELASISATPEASMMWYARCMEVTEAIVGPTRMEELMEEFRQKPWQQVETHTWFKAKVSLAEKLFRSSFYEVAILHFRDLLLLNPSDDLELRYYLMAGLIGENRLDEVTALFRQYPDDLSAKWYYGRAFLRFKMEGDTRRSRRALAKAFQRNLWVPVYLLGIEELPPSNIMVRRNNQPYKLGSRREAADCVKCIGQVFCEDPKLTWWVWEVLKNMSRTE